MWTKQLKTDLKFFEYDSPFVVLNGFDMYRIHLDGSIQCKPYRVRRNGIKGDYVQPGRRVTISKDNKTGYAKVMLKSNDGKRPNMLYHRVIYCAFNGLDYTNRKLIVCHINDDRTNNKLDNLYGGSQLDNMKDIQLKNRLLGLYKKGKIVILE